MRLNLLKTEKITIFEKLDRCAMQDALFLPFWSHGYTVVSYQAHFRLSVHKNPAVYFSGANFVCSCIV